MSRFLVSETEAFFLATVMFFSGKFRYLDGINVHDIGVISSSGGKRVMLNIGGGFRVTVGNFFSLLPLSWEADCFLVPFINSTRGSFHLIDLSHER